MDKIKYTFFGEYFGLYDPFPDSDGLYNGCTIPLNQALFLYRITHISFITAAIGLINNYTWLASGTAIGSCIAHSYWYNPRYNWIRRLDIATVQVLIWTHLWTAIDNPRFTPYISIQIIGAIFYILGLYLHKHKEVWGSTISHSLVHICANLSLIILYTS